MASMIRPTAIPPKPQKQPKKHKIRTLGNGVAPKVNGKRGRRAGTRSLNGLRRVSVQRGKQLIQYYKARRGFLESNPYCQINSMKCTGKATEIHHSRGRINRFLNDRRYFIPSCRICHNWVHANPKLARKAGYLK